MTNRRFMANSVGRYTPLRLFTTTIPLVDNVHSIQPHCPIFGSITVDFPFDLRVPGWLPPTLVSLNSSNLYGVVATAKIGWANETVLSFVNEVTPLRFANGQKALARLSCSAYNAVHIRRHQFPSAISEYRQSRASQHAIRSRALPIDVVIRHADDIDLHDPRGIKIDMLLRAHVSREGWDDCDTENETCSSASDQDVEMAPNASTSSTTDAWPKVFKRNETIAHVTHLAMEIEEREDVHSTPFPSFTAAFPVPPASEQPGPADLLLGPSRAMLNPFPLYPDMVEPLRKRTIRACLRSPDGTPQAHYFATPRPIDNVTKRIKGSLTFHPTAKRVPQPDVVSPFVRVSHFLKTHVTFLLGTGHEVVETYRTPIRLATSPLTHPSSRQSASAAPPPYIRMFTENGEARCDPLPVYSGMDVDDEAVGDCGGERVELERVPSYAESTAPSQTSSPISELRSSRHSSPALDDDMSSPSSRASQSGSVRSRSAADDLSPASRKLLEQWLREESPSRSAAVQTDA